MKWVVLLTIMLATTAVGQAPDPDACAADPSSCGVPPAPCDPTSIDPNDPECGALPDPSVPEVPPTPPMPPANEPPGMPAYRIPNGSAEPGAAPSEFEFPVWSDGQYIRDLPTPGVDLIDLRVWEADYSFTGGGLMMRYEFAVSQGVYSDFEIRTILAPDDPERDASAVVLSSSDGAQWASNALILDAAAYEGPAIVSTDLGSVDAAMRHVIHLHVPYDLMDIHPGESVTDWRTSASGAMDGERSQFDAAPGGYYLAGAELPEANADGELDNSSLSDSAPAPAGYFLAGAGRHLEVSGAWENGLAVIEIENPYAQTSQHVYLIWPDSTQPVSTADAELAPGQKAAFSFSAELAEARTLQWAVRSTPTGGYASMEVALPAAPVDPEPSGSSSGGQSSSPGGRIIIERTDPVFDPPMAATDGQIPVAPEAEEEKGEDAPIGVWLVPLAILIALRRRN